MKHPTAPPDSTGLFAHSAGLLAHILGYLRARLSLAGLEAKAAGAHYGITAVMFAGALFIAVLGYVFLVITAVFAIAAACGGDRAWIAVMGGAAVLHLGGAALLVWLARRRSMPGAFEDTRAELKKDQQWLTHLTTKH
ncbi:MAG: phage holin family protein [Chthoniobacteraceae bacterium]